MTTTDPPLTVQFITAKDQSEDQIKTQLGITEPDTNFSLLNVNSPQTHPQDLDEPDCFLIETNAEEVEWIDTIQHIHETYPADPIIVGTAGLGCEQIEEILKTDNVDIVDSALTDSPPALVHQRITSNVEREHALQGREQILRDLSENVQDVMWVSDREKTSIDFVSSAYEDVWGRSREELYENPLAFVDGVHPDDQQRVREALERQREDPDSYDEIYRVKRPDGEIRWIHDRAFSVSQPAIDDRIVGIARDITERRRQEEELREAKILLEAAIKAGNIGTWQFDVETEEIVVDAEFAEKFGVDPDIARDGVPIERYIEGVLPEDRPRIRRALEQAFETCGTYDVEARVQNTAGEVRWIVGRGEVQCDENGDPQSFPGVLIDITEQKQREQELERSRDLLRDTEQIAQTGGWEVDVETGQQRWTAGTYAIHEVSQDFDPTLESGIEFYHPEDQAQIEEAFERCVETGEPYDLELRIITAKGNVRWIRTRGHAIREDGDITHVRGAIRDITDRKEYERELERIRNLQSHTREIGGIGGFEYDTSADAFTWKHGFAELFHADVDASDIDTLDDALEYIHPEDREKVLAQIQKTVQTNKRVEFTFRVPNDGEPYWARTIVEPEEVDDQTVLRGLFQDITEQKRREQTLQEQRDQLAQLDRLNRLIRQVHDALLDANTREEVEQTVCERLSQAGHYKHAIVVRNPTEGRLEATAWTESGQELVERYFPVDNQTSDISPALKSLETHTCQVRQDIEELSESVSWRDEVLDEGIRSLAVFPIVFEDKEYGVFAVHSTTPNAFASQELEVLEELGETVGHSLAAIESREREEILRSLYEATQDLLAAEDEDAVCNQIVSTAADVLDPDNVGIFLFDDVENALRPVAMTDHLIEVYGEDCRFGPGRTDSAVWQAYATGEVKEIDDLPATEHAPGDTDAFQCGIFIPLGERGVFIVESPDKRIFSPDRRQLIGLLAATTESALDRVTGLSDLHQRDRQIENLVQERNQIQDLLELLRTVEHVLLTGRTREEIERDVCKAVLGLDGVSFAWIGDIPPGSNEVKPRSWTGEQAGYLDEIPIDVQGEEPAGTAARTGDVQRVDNVTDQVQEAPWARAAAERGFQSVIAIPLLHGDTAYGVLTIYGCTTAMFPEKAISVFEELGQIIAAGINEVELERGILSDRVTEVEIELRGTNTFLNTVAEFVGDRVAYREVLPLADEDTRIVFELAEVKAREIDDIADEFVNVQSVEQVEVGEKQLIRSVISGETIARTVLECGGIPREIVADSAETTATVHIPPELDVRVFLQRLGEPYREAELRSRRVVEPEYEIRDAVRVAFEEQLTDRQREVLVTAYESGFFESPRQMTGSELADLLGISQPTLTHHLREAQRRVFETLLDETVDAAQSEPNP